MTSRLLALHLALAILADLASDIKAQFEHNSNHKLRHQQEVCHRSPNFQALIFSKCTDLQSATVTGAKSIIAHHCTADSAAPLAEIRMAARTTNISFESVEQAEGVGARVRRSIGRAQLRNFDPFLMLDEFRVKAPSGFPDHPHRGFETVTYMLSGETIHEDFMGHKGKIKAGDLQWMTAGRGIVHCEMPGQGESHGLQLWVNLKKEDKMIAPAYQELLDEDIPRGESNGVSVKVIAGEAFGIKSPVYTRTPTTYLDFEMSPGSELDLPLPKEWNVFIYILTGEAWFGPAGSETLCKSHHTTTFNNDGELIRAINKGAEPCHFVLIGGQPLKEPIVQHGPFVMTSQEDIHVAFIDYQTGKNGFENAKTWSSSYAK